MTAAKTALKRKKQHEHSLEQTVAQIGTLEQQINAIESANINKETLLAMEKASEAMKQIHGKLTPEKVDETMYASFPLPSSSFATPFDAQIRLANIADRHLHTGTSYGTKTRSAKRSSTPSRATQSESLSTTTSWRRNSTSYNRRSWTSRCSRPEQCQCPIRSSESPPHLKTVSSTRRKAIILHLLMSWNSQGQDAGRTGGRRRGGAAEAAGRDGHVGGLGRLRGQIRCQEHITRACPETFWPGDRSRQEDCPEQIGMENCFRKSFRDWRWRTGGCIRDCEGIRGQQGGSQLYNFRTILNSPSYCLLIRA